MGTRSVAQESSQKAPFLPIQSNNQPRLLTILSSIPPLKTVWRSGVYIPLPDQQQYNQKRLQEASPPKSQRVPNFSIKSEKLEQLTKEREMTVRKTVPGTQLLLYSAAVLVVAPLCCYGCCTYSGWCGCGSSGLFNFHLNFFFLLCFFHRCCSTTGEFLNGQYVSVLVSNIVIH